ncbi:N-acetylmuramoyl-L-alanine amidase [Longispora albida]|uniref:golvesin C-terminal-like domain-containing protein n=1 Tax=Longispora albida TaxID=203523 RepID=UPI0005918249|nr:N-acetylmuramoyl-L-alanine amidase [Longispora albida]
MTPSHLSRRAVLLGTGASLGVSLLPAGPASASPGPGLAASGLAVPAPTIASCGTWGARNPADPLTQIGTSPNKILIHHTATPNSTDYTQAHAYSLARSIQNFHMDSRGWSDTGQHFTVSRGGYVMEGRHHSLSHLSTGSGMVVGAHCTGQNDQAIGIENEGTYTGIEPNTQLWNRLVDLCAYICGQYDLPASRIYGHRDFLATTCPGDAFYALLPRLRTEVAARLAAWSVIVDNSSPGFRASANWQVSNFSQQRYGADYRYATPVGASDAAYFSATLPAAASYKVEAWFPADSGYNAATPFVLFTSGGSKTVTVSQQSGGGQWRSLGTYAFGAGTRDVAAVSRWTSGTQYVIADAIRITKV